MRPETRKQFEDLAKKVLEEADGLDVALVDHIEGPNLIQRAVTEALAGVEYDQKRREEIGNPENRAHSHVMGECRSGRQSGWTRCSPRRRRPQRVGEPANKRAGAHHPGLGLSTLGS